MAVVMRKISYKSGLSILALIVLLFTLFISSCSDSKQTSFQGYVEGEFVYIASPFGGRLDELNVHRGQHITKDTPLFYLESEDEREAVHQAEQTWKAAVAQLEDLQKGKRAPELDVVKSQIAQAVANEKNSAIQLQRDEEQYAAGGISKAQLDNTHYLHAADIAKVNELKNQLATSELPARTDQIKAQTAEVAAQRAALGQAEWKLAQKAVSATQSGLVFDTLYRLGEWVNAGQPIVQMLPPQNIKVRFFVPEKQLSTFQINQKIHIKLDGIKNNIPAKVTYISTQAEYTPPVIYSNETRSKLIFMIEAHPTLEQAPLLHPGQPVTVMTS